MTMGVTFWEYCALIAKKADGKFPHKNGDRVVIDEIEAVAKCYANQWSESEALDTLIERAEALQEI